ncbi:hypothetical protein L3X38_037789 [Prunus dulcis]|uniref:Uncharacterized protein n=1 Tax=Prunus dulcis TaxID=3755 RepID=A0AAD4YQS8_PRUDU|nr:hypothetical protein L3X38_037789 [Prunus dulcis]
MISLSSRKVKVIRIARRIRFHSSRNLGHKVHPSIPFEHPISPPSPQPPPLVPWPPCRRRRHCSLLAVAVATVGSLPSPAAPLPLLFSLRHSRFCFLCATMSDLIRRGRTMTTAPSSDPPVQSASAATAPALMDPVVVGPGPSQAPASSASSVAQPASARRRHQPTDTIDTTSTDGTGASGSQPGITTLLYC